MINKINEIEVYYMDTLVVFILGVLSTIIVLPVLQYCSDLICTFIDLFKSKINIEICKCTSEIQKIQDNINPTESNVIGFEIPSECYDECEEDEETEESLKRHIGFRG